MGIRPAQKLKASVLLVGLIGVEILLALGIPYFLFFFRLRKLVPANQALNELFMAMFLLLLFLMLLATFSSLFLYNQIIRKPIQKIEASVLEIAQSESGFGLQIQVPEEPDLQKLTSAINSLSANVKKSLDENERKSQERTRLVEEGSRLVQEVLDTTPNLLCLQNVEIDQYNYLNREFCDYFEMDCAELIHLGPTFFRGRIHPGDRKTFIDHEATVLASAKDQVTQSDFRVSNGKGEWHWLSIRSIIFERNREQEPQLILHVGQDITHLKEIEEKLRFLSIHDQLTGIYNRLYFEEELARLERGRAYPVTVIMIDLDNLKLANDTFGHAQGDELLKVFAGILRSSFRAEDVIARVGGDEFAALLPQTDAISSEKVVSRIMDKLQTYNAINPRLQIHMSIGCHTIEKGESLTNALQTADERMYQIKQQKKDGNHNSNLKINAETL